MECLALSPIHLLTSTMSSTKYHYHPKKPYYINNVTSRSWHQRPNNPSNQCRRITQHRRYHKLHGQPSHLTTLLHFPSALVVMGLKHIPEARNSSHLQFPTSTLSMWPQKLMPSFHKHFLHTRHMQIVLLACWPITPAPPFAPAPMARAAHFSIQVKLDLPVVEHHGELRAAWVEVEPTRLAMIHEPGYVLLAGIAKARGVPGCSGEELEGALGVERVEDGRSGYGAVHVEIKVTYGALVAWTDAYFLAAIALEWDFCVLELELVLGVAEVGYLIEFHGFLGW